MQILNLVKSFARSESGAVTVDWVVLTAALVGLALAVIVAITPGLNNAANAINNDLNNANNQTLGG